MEYRNLISKRVLGAIDHLVVAGLARSINEVCKTIGFSRSNYKLLELGERSVPLSIIIGVIENYKVRPDWIFKGLEPAFEDGTVLGANESIESLEKEIERLNEMVEIQRETITVQKDLIKKLKRSI